MNPAVSLFRRWRSALADRGAFFRGVVTLLSGTLLARVIAVLAIPLLARLYSPEEFGALALFTTIAGLVAAVASGRYDMAVVLPAADEEAVHLVLASMLLASLVTVVSLIAVWWHGDLIAAAFGSPELAPWLWFSPAVIWTLAAFATLRSWAARAGRFGVISRSVVANTLLTALTQLAVAVPRPWLPGGLIVGRVVGQTCQSLLLLLGSWAGMRAACTQGVSLRRLGAVMHRYRDFPLFDAGANLLNQASRELPVLLLGAFFGPTVLGFYSVGRRMLSLPVELVGNAVAQAFFPQAAQELARGRLAPLTADVFERLVMVAITPLLLIAIVTPEIVQVFLGDAWSEATVYVRWLTVWVLVVFITAPFAQLFNVLEQQRQRLVYTSLLVAGQVGVLWWAGQAGDPVQAVALFSVVTACGTLANYLWLLAKAGVGLGRTLGVLARQLLLALPFAGALWAISLATDSAFGVLSAAALIGIVFAALQMPRVLAKTRASAG
ncbi:MAG: oligosaccharide flippase family protein [Gammaproteobacteria bacterium]|jgi:O-antigen/teichoic acid export membrane protein|nr:oligosaccharide flippase family protein [Gammaproteobacteria bacterium]